MTHFKNAIPLIKYKQHFLEKALLMPNKSHYATDGGGSFQRITTTLLYIYIYIYIYVHGERTNYNTIFIKNIIYLLY